ncbi:E3 ubiquitin protein ligase DRIP2-like isoform X2 [Rhododendron vialii]|uniref:E3 ubiquitin protein ligase DRIP2-like isoform X2 n=1 Tax=Rhododendron vialii TaxID=182163 RepID=UPI00265FE14D|nr:E3 ubiquitin protein ligase DRIP2-like isoform X2 [Rhododendron vialii]
MTSQVVKVRREILAECMTCPLCNKLLREATTISLCLHTFCRKCIYEKFSDDDVDSCPVCDINLGCVPVEKLRPDHNLQDIRAKIFPFKRKVRTPEVTPSISLPVKRKERSLSSLVVSTPKVSIKTGLTARRTKSVARKSAPIRASSFVVGESIKKEELPTEICHESSCSPETLNKVRDKNQSSSPTKSFPHQLPNKDKEKDVGVWKGNVDQWKPLNCLVEAANRTKSSKHNLQYSAPVNALDSAVHVPNSAIHVPKIKIKEHKHKSKLKDDQSKILSLLGLVKRRRLAAVDQKNTVGRSSASAQAMLNVHGGKKNRRNCPIWFSLVASEDQEGDIPLPQISACYLRIKNGNLPVSFIQKYLVKKLDLTGEAEVEILCHGQPVLPTLQLQSLADLWLQMASTSKERVPAYVGSSAKDFVMALSYSRRVLPH